jgi:hypothetical protein
VACHHTVQSRTQGSGTERGSPTMQGNCGRRCVCFGGVGRGSSPHPASFPPVAGRFPAARAERRRPTLSWANRYCPAAQSANYPRSEPGVPRRRPFPAAPHCAGPAVPSRNPASYSCIVASASPSRVVIQGGNDTFPQFNSCATTQRTAEFRRLGAGRWGNANQPIRVLIQKAVARHCVLGQRTCKV